MAVAAGGGGHAARVLTVNAGSTSLKLHVVEAGEAEAVDDLVAADAVGHRVVHGGPRLVEPALVDDEVEAEIEAVTPLAPLHNAPALAALRRARAELPDVPHVAVFDTAFHATIPAPAATYALPERWRVEWGIRRYGFHGLAVQWAAEQVREARVVVCHLGGGCSVTAVLNGRSVDTSMGFTPLEGVLMATRSGSVDPGALIYVMREHGLSADEVDDVLEHESGLLGLGGTAGVRDLLAAEAAGDARAAAAVDVFVHQVARAVGAMTTSLGGLDALVFSGGAGEKSPRLRERIVERVAFLEPRVVVVHTREELVIARAVQEALNR